MVGIAHLSLRAWFMVLRCLGTKDRMRSLLEFLEGIGLRTTSARLKTMGYVWKRERVLRKLVPHLQRTFQKMWSHPPTQKLVRETVLTGMLLAGNTLTYPFSEMFYRLPSRGHRNSPLGMRLVEKRGWTFGGIDSPDACHDFVTSMVLMVLACKNKGHTDQYDTQLLHRMQEYMDLYNHYGHLCESGNKG